MEIPSVLDLGGNTTMSSVTRSHLGAGSPRIHSETHHSKRAKHYSEESEQNISLLKSKVSSEIIELLQTGQLQRPLALIYNDVERLCVAKHAEQALLAGLIRSEIDKAIKSVISVKVSHCINSLSAENLKETASAFVEIWRDWDRQMSFLLQICLYLDRSYLLHHPKHPRIKDYGALVFKNCIKSLFWSLRALGAEPDALSRLVTQLIIKSKNANPDEAYYNLAEKVLTALGEIDPANELLVNAYLVYIFIDVYEDLRKVWLKDLKMYVSTVIDSISSDVKMLLLSERRTEFVQMIDTKLKWKYLLADLNFYVKPAFSYLASFDGLETLEKLRRICSTSMDLYGVNLTNILVACWGKYVQEAVKTLAQSTHIVQELLILWARLLLVCEGGPESDAFTYELRSSWQKALKDKDLSLLVVMGLTKFCDRIMRFPGSNMSKLLESMIAIFHLIPDKLSFISLYEKDLSKRILLFKNFEYAHEKEFVDLIVGVVGENDENFKMRAMLRDYQYSKSSFSNLQLPQAPRIDFSALVLEKKVWPDIPGFGPDVQIPESLGLVFSDFEKHYMTKDGKNKVLDWKNYTLHQITLTSSFGGRTKDLQVNLAQAVVLMMFESNETLSIEEVRESTKFDDKLLRRTVASLATEKYPILIVENEQIRVNDNFTAKSNLIKLPMAREKESGVSEGVKTLIQRSRSSESRAALVRIMKSHKTLPYTELLAKAIDELEARGAPLVLDLKTEIEYLILTEYIQRDSEGNTLNYIP